MSLKPVASNASHKKCEGIANMPISNPLCRTDKLCLSSLGLILIKEKNP